MSWTTEATVDPEQIKRWWRDPVTGFPRDYNIGFLTTGWVVPDVDVKKGKRGLATFAELGLEWDTLTCITPSGGYHLIYRGLDQLVGSGHLLSPQDGVDIKSHNAYVLAPGSTIDGREYRVELDLPVAEFPTHLRQFLKAPRERREQIVFNGKALDSPEAIEVAAHWLLRDAAVAIEGQGGDATTYRVACKLRDFGLSEATAFDLLLDEYNPRCEPPWEAEELRAKVANAYRYAVDTAGALNPVASFGQVIIPGPYLNGHSLPFGVMLDSSEIHKRPWIMGNWLMSRIVTSVVGPSEAGKSLFGLMLAAHYVCGREFLGQKVEQPGKAIVYDAEDDVEEMSRRLIGICAVYDLPVHQVRRRLKLLSGDEISLKVTEGRPVKINNDHVAKIMAACGDPEVRLLAAGPLIDMHTAPENDPMEMNYVMGCFRMVARQSDVAVLLGHHTAKPPVATSTNWAGNQYAGRGSTSVPGASRIMLTLFPASPEDCIEYGIPAGEKRAYVRLDDAKMNFSPRSSKPRWLKWRSIAGPNDESIGVLEPYDLMAADQEMTEALTRAILLKEGQRKILDVVKDVGKADPRFEREGELVVRNRILRVFERPVRAGTAVISLEKTPHGQKNYTKVSVVHE